MNTFPTTEEVHSAIKSKDKEKLKSWYLDLPIVKTAEDSLVMKNITDGLEKLGALREADDEFEGISI